MCGWNHCILLLDQIHWTYKLEFYECSLRMCKLRKNIFVQSRKNKQTNKWKNSVYFWHLIYIIWNKGDFFCQISGVCYLYLVFVPISSFIPCISFVSLLQVQLWCPVCHFVHDVTCNDGHAHRILPTFPEKCSHLHSIRVEAI